MKETLKRLDVWCKMALMALFVLLYLMARSYPAESRQFPQLIAVFTLVLCSGFSFAEAASFAALAAGIVVGKPGASTAGPTEILESVS